MSPHYHVATINDYKYTVQREYGQVELEHTAAAKAEYSSQAITS